MRSGDVAGLFASGVAQFPAGAGLYQDTAISTRRPAAANIKALSPCWLR